MKKIKLKAVGEVFTEQTLRDAIQRLKSNNLPHRWKPFFWIEKRHWYKSEMAKVMGFLCTDTELDAVNEKGFIKQAKGVDLYLAAFRSPLPIKKRN